MKLSRSIFCVVFCVVSASYGMSLQDAIRVALQNNPKTVANQLRVRAMQDRIKAQQAELLPALRLSASDDMSNDSGMSSVSRGVRASTSITIYDGGADANSRKAAEASLKAADARYSSSNALIPNTKGSIAKEVKNAYVDLIDVAEQQKYLSSLEQILQLFMSKNPSEDEKLLIQQRLNNLSTSLIRTQSNFEASLKDFRYFATVPAPDLSQLQSFEEVTQSLTIPANPEEAFQIALQKSPNLKQAEYELEAAQYQYKSEKAKLYSPKITLGASVGRTNSAIDGARSGVTSKAIGINLNYTLSSASHLRDSAAAKNVEATSRDRDGAIDELKYEIESIYPSLASQEKLFQSQLQNLQSAEASLDAIVKKLEAGQKVDFKIALSVLDSRSQYWSNCMAQRRSILDTRFNIQRTVGILFESLGMSWQAMSALN